MDQPAEHSQERLRDRITDAAIEAEFETGEHEESVAAAKAHIVVRLSRMSFGSALCCLGLVMFVTPGPGWLVLAAGLAVLSRDVAWADRMLQRVRDRLPQDADGRIPRSAIVTMVLATAAFTAASIWWMLR